MSKIALSDDSSEFQSVGFLPCKNIVDQHYRCITSEKFGRTIDDVPVIALESAENFFECTFHQMKPISACRQHLD